MESESSVENMSASNIVALSNVKEVPLEKKNYSHFVILLIMAIFAFLMVYLSVFNFSGLVTQQNAQGVSSYGSQIHKLSR